MKTKKEQKRIHRVVLKFPLGLTSSVFIRSRDREDAERRALRQHPEAVGIDHPHYPQS